MPVLALGGIRKNGEELTYAEGPQRRVKLRLWPEHDLREWFGVRILPIGPEVVDHWGRLLALASRPVPAIDSLLAAMALEVIKCWAENIAERGHNNVWYKNQWMACTKRC